MQSQNGLNLSVSAGVAVCEFTLEKLHGRVDYLLFVDDEPRRAKFGEERNGGLQVVDNHADVIHPLNRDIPRAGEPGT